MDRRAVPRAGRRSAGRDSRSRSAAISTTSRSWSRTSRRRGCCARWASIRGATRSTASTRACRSTSAASTDAPLLPDRIAIYYRPLVRDFRTPGGDPARDPQDRHPRARARLRPRRRRHRGGGLLRCERGRRAGSNAVAIVDLGGLDVLRCGARCSWSASSTSHALLARRRAAGAALLDAPLAGRAGRGAAARRRAELCAGDAGARARLRARPAGAGRRAARRARWSPATGSAQPLAFVGAQRRGQRLPRGAACRWIGAAPALRGGFDVCLGADVGLRSATPSRRWSAALARCSRPRGSGLAGRLGEHRAAHARRAACAARGFDRRAARRRASRRRGGRCGCALIEARRR